MSQGIVNKNTIKRGKMESDSKQSEILPSQYGCDILLEKTKLEDTKDKTFPLDAYLVWYVSEGKEYLDPFSYTHLTLPTNREVVIWDGSVKYNIKIPNLNLYP